MNIDNIEVGKTYAMRGALNRHVIDIIWHPAGGGLGGFTREYREAVVEIIGGVNGTRRAKESLSWLAANAVKAIDIPPLSNGGS